MNFLRYELQILIYNFTVHNNIFSSSKGDMLPGFLFLCLVFLFTNYGFCCLYFYALLLASLFKHCGVNCRLGANEVIEHKCVRTLEKILCQL